MSSLSSSPSSGTSRSSKRQSLSTIESSVTRLLVSTKHLLESLTQWARHEADDKFVSDAYVKLGNDFRAATRAFTSAGVDISDIGDVPQALRIILEAALSEPPSQENLDRFLPNIRNIIVTLLQNLKSKQVKAKVLSQEKQQRSKQLTAEQITPTPTSTTDTPVQNRKTSNPPPRQPQASQNDALAQLQNSNLLQRRASKRFSAYQYAKLTNFPSPNGLPKITSDSNTNRSLLVPTNDHVRRIDEVKEIETKAEQTFIFLKIGNKTKKIEIKLPVSFASLRLLFVEKFAYSPGSSSFPEIYIEDPKSGVTYELEDHLLDDVKCGSLLCLNVSDGPSDIQKSLEVQFEMLTAKVESISTGISNEIKSAVSSIEIPAPIQPAVVQEGKKITSSLNPGIIREVVNIQRDLKVMRQLQSNNKETIKTILGGLILKVREFQESGLDVSKSSNRAYMDSCHLKLSEESDQLLTKVDDLQDIMEALRKDVAQRGVRVSEKQLKNTKREIEEARTSLRTMTGYISSEKSVWKKIWEAELDKVCEEQQFFNLQDDLTQDLEDDIKKIQETFDLIEQCSSEQTKQSAYKRNRVVAQLHIPEPGESIHGMKDAVLNEVAALRPNHESRLEAIEKAEKLRERERELMKLSKFQEELGEFVEDGKLKKSGGIEEVERMRKEKDNENLKSSFGII
ncbi:AIP3-domain-containing protein [Suhomyces tanzawaensis NRRL Y-17324]|uniref:AIP3-domain-containing protein n=1 Tax=Suhomyces tanzawaensis NRRL Y-17324 TaxID=984487 RepID=A0A1E4SAZ4_9ASCO|nr:AIP3-domain-containing protein [Suhomyces tanzawaensis NRRL Y-17324]ODV76679.1 AIP3-domain-containing protein [Suhomyces tanzawaensis NRRL Y-17324]